MKNIQKVILPQKVILLSYILLVKQVDVLPSKTRRFAASSTCYSWFAFTVHCIIYWHSMYCNDVTRAKTHH